MTTREQVRAAVVAAMKAAYSGSITDMAGINARADEVMALADEYGAGLAGGTARELARGPQSHAEPAGGTDGPPAAPAPARPAGTTAARRQTARRRTG